MGLHYKRFNALKFKKLDELDKFDQSNLFCLSFERSYFGEPINIEAKTHKHQPTKENSKQQMGTFTLPLQFPPFFMGIFIIPSLSPSW